MYYIRIDVSKKDLSVFDGKDLKFANKEGLKSFKKYLKKKYPLSEIVIIFEPTGIYSFYLKAFCAENSIKAYIVNPKKSHNFTQALGKHSKTDKIDACTLYQFHKLINIDSHAFTDVVFTLTDYCLSRSIGNLLSSPP